MWIRWIHSVYIKNNGLDTLIIPKTAALGVKKLFETREFVLWRPRVQGDLMSRLTQLQHCDGFSIKKINKHMRTHYQRIPWKNMILRPQLHLRFKFILWPASYGILATVDRLIKMCIQVPQTCVFYGLNNEVFEQLYLAAIMWEHYGQYFCIGWAIKEVLELGN